MQSIRQKIKFLKLLEAGNIGKHKYLTDLNKGQILVARQLRASPKQ